MHGCVVRYGRQVAWAVVALAIGGCSRSAPDSGPIVLIVVDTLRADHVSCYGYPRPTTPNICQLAADGVRFERAYAPRTNTTPSIATMLTGRYPYRHGIRDLYRVLPPESVTIAERLREQGYRTGAFVSSFVMVRDFSGFDQGFEIYDDYVRTKEALRENYERPAKLTVNRALHWLEGAGTRAFLFLHLIEPHGPYMPPPDELEAFALPAEGATVEPMQAPPYQRIPGLHYVNEFVGRYDGEIATADREIGRFLGRLREWGRYQTATVVVVADHGESMGEDGIWFAHGGGWSEAETHVPLVVKFPAGTPGIRPGTVVREPVSVVDVFPTVLAAAGLRDDTDDVATGMDLGAIATGRPRRKPLPVTETPHHAGLAFTAHGPECTARWIIPWSAMTEDRVLIDTTAAARWPALTLGVNREPLAASDACTRDVLRSVTPLMTDLLTYKLKTTVVHRADMGDRAARSAFVNQRGDPLVPLQEHEREALRKLGYLE